MPAKRLDAIRDVRFNSYALFTRAVEEGLQRGWNRAHKHTDAPGEEAVIEAMLDAVMLEFSEILIFDDLAK